MVARLDGVEANDRYVDCKVVREDEATGEACEARVADAVGRTVMRPKEAVKAVRDRVAAILGILDADELSRCRLVKATSHLHTVGGRNVRYHHWLA